MASKVSITNRALVKLGVKTITSLTEEVDQARTINAIFDDALDYLITVHHWNFATERTSLARLSGTPSFQYTYQYQLPTNPYCLKVLMVYDSDEDEIEDYKIEGRKVITDETLVYLKYLKRVTDMNELPPPFREMFSTYLAKETVDKFTGSARLKNQLQNEYLYTLKVAKLTDSTEDRPRSRQEGSWLTIRG